MLAYTNNLKMKLSVILAILQMSMGIIMKGFNAAYFKKPLDFLFEFIPQIVLILALFGWMDLLIIAKWVEPKDVYKNYNLSTETEKFNEVNLSPPIITTMIDMFLAFGGNTKYDQNKKMDTEKYHYVLGG